MELESGEYFLKAKEKEAREARKRKEKVRPTTTLSISDPALRTLRFVCALSSISKKRSARSGGRSVRRRSWLLSRRLRLRWKRSGNGDESKRRGRTTKRTVARKARRRESGQRRRRSGLFSSFHSFLFFLSLFSRILYCGISILYRQ